MSKQPLIDQKPSDRRPSILLILESSTIFAINSHNIKPKDFSSINLINATDKELFMIKRDQIVQDIIWSWPHWEEILNGQSISCWALDGGYPNIACAESRQTVQRQRSWKGILNKEAVNVHVRYVKSLMLHWFTLNVIYFSPCITVSKAIVWAPSLNMGANLQDFLHLGTDD